MAPGFEMKSHDTPEVMKLATEIIVAFLAQRALEPEHLPGMIRDVRAALLGETGGAAPLAPAETVRSTASVATAGTQPEADTADLQTPSNRSGPPVDPGQTVFDDHIICLEDGHRYRSLRRHLMAKYSMTPDQYRAKWGLPEDYPMVAPSYARERSVVAKRIGLGHRAQANGNGRGKSRSRS